MMRARKGQATLYIVFMMSAVVILLIAAVFAPLGVLLNTRLYAAGEGMMLDAQSEIGAIQDETVRNQINASITAGLLAGQNNIDVNAGLFQYGWVLVLVLSALIAFIYTRRTVEFGGGFV